MVEHIVANDGIRVRFSYTALNMNKNENIEKNYDKILNYKINLFDIAVDESFEKGLSYLSQISGNIECIQFSNDRLNLRRSIFDKLIQDTGGIVSLSDIKSEMSESLKQESASFSVLTYILFYLADYFCKNPEHKKVLDEIVLDRAYQEGIFDNLSDYIHEYIGEKEGFYKKR